VSPKGTGTLQRPRNLRDQDIIREYKYCVLGVILRDSFVTAIQDGGPSRLFSIEHSWCKFGTFRFTTTFRHGASFVLAGFEIGCKGAFGGGDSFVPVRLSGGEDKLEVLYRSFRKFKRRKTRKRTCLLYGSSDPNICDIRSI
jgi:hypothetical protein